jgi:hypothetical protein
VLLLLPATALLEPSAFARTQELLATNSGFLGWLLFNSFMAYAVNLTNFMVTKYTSALTLQVRARARNERSGGRGCWRPAGRWLCRWPGGGLPGSWAARLGPDTKLCPTHRQTHHPRCWAT